MPRPEQLAVGRSLLASQCPFIVPLHEGGHMYVYMVAARAQTGEPRESNRTIPLSALKRRIYTRASVEPAAHPKLGTEPWPCTQVFFYISNCVE